MDTQAIEQTAIQAVQERINLTKNLSSYLDVNDKTPSWDGFIFIYKNSNRTKENLIGRIAAQIKGHEDNILTNDTISFSIDISDLKNFLNDGGAILFVVYINTNQEQTEIMKQVYYTELTPVKLSAIISNCPIPQQRKTLKLKVLSSNPDDFASMVLNCYNNCKRQASFSGSKLPTIDELEKKGVLESLQMFVAGFGEEYKTPSGFLKIDTPLYAKIKGMSIPQPLRFEGETLEKIIAYDRNWTVACGGAVYFNVIKFIESTTKIIIRFGCGISLSYSKKEKTCNLNFKASHMMREFVNDAPFIIAFLTNKSVMIKNTLIDFSTEEVYIKGYDIEALKHDYSILSRFVKLLNAQGCIDDLDYTKLTKEDLFNLEQLSKATLEGKPVKYHSIDIAPIMIMKVSQLQFAISLKPVSGEKDTYTLCHFQDGQNNFIYVPPDESKSFSVPICAALNSEHFVHISNIRFNRILPEIQSLPPNSYAYGIVNQIMLSIINASDQVEGEQKQRLLNTALEISDWLYNFPADAWDKDISILNRLQILKRQRRLSEDERELLYALIINNDKRDDILFAAYTLLDKNTEALLHFNKLPNVVQTELKKFPIYNLFKSS